MKVSFRIHRSDTFLGKTLQHGESGTNVFTRLGTRNNRWSRPVHETWAGNEGILLNNLIEHIASDDLSPFISKINIYTSTNAQYLYKRGVRAKWWHIILYPAGKFIQNYILKRGFLDGTHGFVHAMLMSFHSFLTRGKLWHLTSP